MTVVIPSKARSDRTARAVTAIERIAGRGLFVRGHSAPLNALPMDMKIVSGGPDGEPDYTNNTYWAKRVRLANTDTDPVSAVTFEVLPADHPDYLHVLVSNDEESILGTHLLQLDEIISVRASVDRGQIVSNRRERTTRFHCNVTPALKPTLKITGNSTIGGHPYQWLYSGIEQTLSVPSGVPTATNKSGAPTWTNLVINRRELKNPTSAGVIPSAGGIDITAIPGTVTVLPLANDTTVPFERIVIGGTAYYLVDAPNGLSVECA